MKKVIHGFPGSGGRKEDDCVYSIHKNKPTITIGAPQAQKNKPVKELKKILKHASIDVNINNRMDCWLKYHIALVSPVANAIYSDGGDNYSLSKNNELLTVMTKAIREGYLALKSLSYKVEPGKLKRPQSSE